MTEKNDAIKKLFLHDKPFILLKFLYYNNGIVHSAAISKKIDCSYAYITRLISRMEELGIIETDKLKHKKLIRLTQKGIKIFKALDGLDN